MSDPCVPYMLLMFFMGFALGVMPTAVILVSRELERRQKAKR